MDWYFLFIILIFILWMFSTPMDRYSLRIILISSITSEFVVDFISNRITSAWKLIIPGALEVGTILALLHWAKNRTGYTQSALLVVAWLAHTVCYWDIFFETDVVYSHYEAILFWVAVGQLATCYDTMLTNLGRIWDSAASAWADCLVVVHHPGRSAALSVVETGEKNPSNEGNGKAIQSAPLMSK